MNLFHVKYAVPVLLVFSGLRLVAQPTLASVELRTLRGATEKFAALTAKDSIVLVCFWSTGSERSIDELNAINAQYEKWKQTAVFKMMAICEDEGRDVGRVRPLVNVNGWVFDVYIDMNGDLRRALQSANLPQSMILVNGQTVYEQSGFEQGSENYLINAIRNILLHR